MSKKYERCVIPIHECLFSLIGFHLSLNDFEVGVLNHLMISPLTNASGELGLYQSIQVLV